MFFRFRLLAGLLPCLWIDEASLCFWLLFLHLIQDAEPLASSAERSDAFAAALPCFVVEALELFVGYIITNITSLRDCTVYKLTDQDQNRDMLVC